MSLDNLDPNKPVKINEDFAEHFEDEQKEYGTLVALKNVVFTLVKQNLINFIGGKSMTVDYWEDWCDECEDFFPHKECEHTAQS